MKPITNSWEERFEKDISVKYFRDISIILSRTSSKVKADEAVNKHIDLIKSFISQERISAQESTREKMEKKIEDGIDAFEMEFYNDGDERYGTVKHENTVLQQMVDFLKSNLTKEK